MKPIFILFMVAILAGGCARTRQVMIKESPKVLPSRDEIFWVPASHKGVLVNRKENEDGSYDQAHYRTIRVKDGYWGTLKELVQRLREEYGHKLEISEKPRTEETHIKQDDWPFKEISSSGK